MRLLTTVLLLSCPLLYSAAITKNKNICENGEVCYSDPENCQLKDCDMILSFHQNGTEIYVNDYDYTQYFIIYTEKAGVRQEEIFTCFAGLPKCYYGIEHGNQPYYLKSKLRASIHTVSDSHGQFVYDFARVIFETGPKVKFLYRKGYPGEDVDNPVAKPLYLVKGPGSGPKVVVDLKPKPYDLDIKTLEELHAKYESLEREEKEDRRKRLARKRPVPLKTISLNDILNERNGYGF